MTKKIDSVTLDIVKDSLMAIGNEVFYSFARTSMSPIIYETLDYACGIADSEGRLLTQGNGACGFIGLISPMIQAVIDKFGKDNMKSGDVYLINDPYMGGGSHLSDIGMMMPVFYDGEIIAFLGNKAHWSDVGGMAAGSFTTDSTEVFQEGLRFSGVKLVDAGEICRPLLDMIKANVRFPDSAEGDMWGQIASLRTGSKRIIDLCAKYGHAVVRESMVRLLDQGEILSRKRLLEFPKGSWEAEEFMDDDGHGNPVLIKVKVTITDDEFIADYSGSSPQVVSPINTGYTSLCAGAKIAYMSIIDPELVVNDGVFRPLRIIAEPGSVLQCHAPAPTSCYFESMLYATDVLWRALAPVFPEHLGAGHMLSVCSVVLSGTHQDTGVPFLIVEPTGGGWGASCTKDGEVGQFCVGDGETYNVPVEMAETRYGIRVEEYSLHTDGAGAGTFRGGSGAVRIYRAMSDNQLFTASFGRNKYPAWGTDGGADGSYNYFEIIRANGTHEGPMGITARTVLNKNDIVRMVTCTGGGYGDPHKRDVNRVAWDVRNGYITPEQAKNDYGVDVDPITFEAVRR
ncbi:hydantoinase B/oxoprolinase family protein [Desulfitobacterium sp.]|uniref:hydantoinase B/oxoprolinase family protein n=1 Tax=Desulfitobacterium sp. TaxID=49981 RepID=UPI002B21BA8F|nr:hydantoinase B/oxoprolinase family protein [Desulfitobacterium sp.]MEA4900294.1 hydantoinase B/oxoprolinase family protein [Desulfitobacterium sp.]